MAEQNFQQTLLQIHELSEITLISLFDAQETFLLTSLEKSLLDQLHCLIFLTPILFFQDCIEKKYE